MPLAYSKLTTQGQISVPAEIRRRLGVSAGSLLEWEAEGESIVVRRAGRYTSEDIHKALFATTPRRRTLNGLKRGIGRYMRERHARR
jgi:antitoxin PrlF